MSWNNCKKCVFVPRASYTSALFKTLVSLKMLHGTRQGARGSTLEDIAMHMIKHFCLDGDVKGQVLASLNYGVRLNMVQKKKDKYSLIMPASSIHKLAPCRLKCQEVERINSVFPTAWVGNRCPDAMCSGGSSCCGQRPSGPQIGCKRSTQDYDDDDGGSECESRSCPRKRNRESSSRRCQRPRPRPRRSCRPARPKCSACDSGGSGEDLSRFCQPPTNLMDGFQEDAYKNWECCPK